MPPEAAQDVVSKANRICRENTSSDAVPVGQRILRLLQSGQRTALMVATGLHAGRSEWAGTPGPTEPLMELGIV